MLKAEHFSRSCPPIGCQAMLSITRHRLTRGVSSTLGIHNWCPYRPSLLGNNWKNSQKNSHNAARQEANLNWSQKCTTAQMRIPGIVKNSSEFLFLSDFWVFYSRNMNRPIRRSFPPIGVLPSIFSYEVWRARHNIWAVIMRTRTPPIGRAPKSWNP